MRETAARLPSVGLLRFATSNPLRWFFIQSPIEDGRDDWIRTSDFYVPNVALYQAELRPDKKPFYWVIFQHVQPVFELPISLLQKFSGSLVQFRDGLSPLLYQATQFGRLQYLRLIAPAQHPLADLLEAS